MSFYSEQLKTLEIQMRGLNILTNSIHTKLLRLHGYN